MKNLSKHWFRLTFCFLLVSLFGQFAFAQLQPLSRNDKAEVERYLKSYDAELANENWMEASRHMNSVAMLFWEHNDYAKAIEYYEQSLELNQNLNNENGLAMIHNNLGMLYADIREYDRSIDFFQKTLAARRSFDNKEGIIAAIKNISVSQNNLGRFSESLVLLEEALSLAKELSSTDELASCYLMLSETYQKAGDIPNTKKYYELYQIFYDERSEKEKQRLRAEADEEAMLKRIAILKAQSEEASNQKLQDSVNQLADDINQYGEEKVRLIEEIDEKQLQVQFLETEAENEKLKSERQMRQARNVRNLLLLGALSLALIAFFIYRNFKQERRSKLVLADKNAQIEKQNDELESLNAIIAKHNERMKSELDVGREIQMSMIPSHFPDIKGVDLYAALEPAREVGGDLYDFFKIDDDHLIFGIGDVSDKGVPAALFMAVTKTLVKTNANYSALPGQILTEVNKELSRENESSMFVTYFLCLLDIRSGKLNYCNAGHNPPLYISANGQLTKLDQLHGPVLGAIEDFDYGQDEVIMKKGEQIVLFTDGITEAMDINHSQYSNERLDNLFSHNGKHKAKDAVKAILDDVSEFRGEAEQSDDITVLSIIYQGV